MKTTFVFKTYCPQVATLLLALVLPICSGSVLGAQPAAPLVCIDETCNQVAGFENLESLRARFVGSGGDDSNDGRTHATRWATFSPANGLAKGTDVYILTGTKLDASWWRVNWSGEEFDRVIIGSYYIDLGNNNQPTAYQEGTASGRLSQPIIIGDMSEECRATASCIYNDQTIYRSAIAISGDYVTLQDLQIANTLGRAVTVRGLDAPDGEIRKTVIQRIRTSWTGDSGITVEGPVYDTVIRDSTVDHAGHCRMQKKAGGICNYNWPAGIVVTRIQNAQALIENNEVYRSWSEGIGIYTASNVVIRGNRVGDVHSASYYVDASENIVIEHNVAWGNQGSYWSSKSSPNAFSQIGVNQEDYLVGKTVARDPTGIVIRNNLLAGRGTCHDDHLDPAASESNVRIGVERYGNTCVGAFRAVYSNGAHMKNGNVEYLKFENNLSFAPDAVDQCAAVSELEASYNLWSANPEADCRSSGDVITKDVLAQTSLGVWRSYSWDNQPNIEAFRPQVGSSAIGAGNPLLAEIKVLEFAAYPIISEATYPFKPDPRKWEYALVYDFEGTERDVNSSTLGGLERRQ